MTNLKLSQNNHHDKFSRWNNLFLFSTSGRCSSLYTVILWWDDVPPIWKWSSFDSFFMSTSTLPSFRLWVT